MLSGPPQCLWLVNQNARKRLPNKSLIIAHSRLFIILVKIFFSGVEVLLFKNWKFYLEAVLL